MDIGAQIIQNSLQQAGTQQVTKSKEALSQARQEDIANVAKEFEAVFLTQMLSHMFSQIETNEIFGGGHAEDTFRTFLMDEYGKVLSNAGGIGITEQVQTELLKLQEVAS